MALIKTIKKELKFMAIIMIGIFPMLVFLDVVMGVRLSRDFGFWGVIGFTSCVVFYAEVTNRIRD